MVSKGRGLANFRLRIWVQGLGLGFRVEGLGLRGVGFRETEPGIGARGLGLRERPTFKGVFWDFHSTGSRLVGGCWGCRMDLGFRVYKANRAAAPHWQI